MIIVTGGTGLVGSHLLIELSNTHSGIRATYRNKEHIPGVQRLFSRFNKEEQFKNIEWIKADLNDLMSLERAFEGAEHCYHCAALISFDPAQYRKLRTVNIKGTANVVNTCLSAGVKKLCYVSSIATLGKIANRDFIDEDTHWEPGESNNNYAISKYGGELEVWRGTQEGLPAIIVNPGVIFGEGERSNSSNQIVDRVKKGLKYYPQGGTGFVDVKDVVWAMKYCMESDLKNERFILIGENRTYKELLGMIARTLGTTPPEKPLANWMLEVGWRLDWLRNLLTRSPRKLSKSMARSINRISSYSSLKIKEKTGIVFTPLKNTLERIV